jgi:two-component system CheB/CheR fusion protein
MGFRVEEQGYRVSQSLRDHIIFAEQNLIHDPPYSRIDLISCRNLLIYLNKELQEQVVGIFHYALNPQGFLLLGNSETLGSSAHLFGIEDKKHKLFYKLNNKGHNTTLWHWTGGTLVKKRPGTMDIQPHLKLSELTQEILLSDYTPPSVLINPNADILYVQGKTGRYLEFSTGEISSNIIRIARVGLKIALANAIRKTKLNHQETVHYNLKVQSEDVLEKINLIVRPVEKEERDTGMMLVIFQPLRSFPPREDEEEDGEKANSNILELEKELSATQEYLQSTIEELETTNEELKSSNEEAQSTNEELQSANEELETSREELQSVNEELINTNGELQHKIEELSKANSDISNLLTSTQIPTIFLDKELRIFRFTPSMEQIIALQESDIGRPLSQFTNRLNYNKLQKDAQSVLDRLSPREKELKTSDGQYFWMRMVPYRTHNDSIEGVVITFTDISEKKRGEEELIEPSTITLPWPTNPFRVTEIL